MFTTPFEQLSYYEFKAANVNALGAPIEFLPLAKKNERFGWVQEFMANPVLNLQAGEWTDDTAMMVFLLDVDNFLF